MKPILFALSLVLSVLACLNTPAHDESSTEADAVDVPRSPSSFEANDFLSSPEPADKSSCLAACARSYDSCLSTTEDAVSECLCFDASVDCEHRCDARGGAFVRC